MELTLMPLGHTDGMLDFVSLEGEIAELKGATIEAFKAVRFEMSAVHGVDVILLKLKHSVSLHHIYLDCFGLAHWYEGDESGILESIDESATVTHVPLDFPWNSPLRAVTITPSNAQIASIHFLFETGARIIFNYESTNPNLGTQLKFVMQNEEKEMEE